MSDPLLPWKDISTILDTQRIPITAIIASLPEGPQYIQTPGILRLLTGSTGTPWGSYIISHDLFSIYIASIFYIKSHLEDKSSPILNIIRETMLHGQAHVFRSFEEDESSNFTIPYLNVYERAIFKYLHFAKGAQLPTLDHKPTITSFILAEHPELASEQLLSKHIHDQVDDDLRQRLSQWKALQESLHIYEPPTTTT